MIHSYSVKALPAVKPQRLIQLPLTCFDFEAWQSGQFDGRDGWGRDRLAALQSIEDAGDLVNFQDFGQEGMTCRLVKIEKVSFSQASPPDLTSAGGGFGGYITLILRTMD